MDFYDVSGFVHVLCSTSAANTVGILVLFVAGRAIDDNDIRSGVVTDMTALTGSSLGLGGLYQMLPMLLEECGPRGGCWKLSPLFMPHCETVIKQIHTSAISIADSHCHHIAKGIDRQPIVGLELHIMRPRKRTSCSRQPLLSRCGS